jgi:predicted site-specific integrase-resolvase
MNDEQDWISQAEAARLCKVSPQTIRRWIDQQLIRVRKLPSGRLQVDRWSLDRVIQVIG